MALLPTLSRRLCVHVSSHLFISHFFIQKVCPACGSVYTCHRILFDFFIQKVCPASSKMASPAKIQKLLSSMFANNDPPTKYKNVHCSQSCMKLYMQEESADVHFVFETGNEKEERVPAHKYILGIGSAVFHSMFYGSLQEEGDIKIMDATIDAFKEFLQFFYLDPVSLTMQYVGEMMYLANKYDVSECFKICETFFKEKLPIENVCHILQLAVTFDRKELMEFLLAKVSEKPTHIFASNSFKNCTGSILKLILKIDNLDCDEKAVFDACMVWSEKACEKNNMDPLEMKNRREQLGDCFHLIRFAAMEPLHISQCVSKHQDLFKRDELLEIIAMLSSDNSITHKAFGRKQGSGIVRQWNNNAILTFSLVYQSGEKHFPLKQAEITGFRSNKKLLLGAVATPPIHPRTRDKPQLSGVLKIVQFTSSTLSEQIILLEQPVNLALGGRYEPRNIIKLTHPIVVEPNKTYEIRIEFDSNWCENVYESKKITKNQAQSFGDCKMSIGRVEVGKDIGIVSHFYFN